MSLFFRMISTNARFRQCRLTLEVSENSKNWKKRKLNKIS